MPEKRLKKVKDKAKNIILFIGDGMSISQITALRLSQGGPNSRVAVDEFPYSGKVLTHSANAIVTDSASSGTAFSAGIKTNNEPAMIPGKLNGNVILKNVFIGPEPKSAAASFKLLSSFSIFA